MLDQKDVRVAIIVPLESRANFSGFLHLIPLPYERAFLSDIFSTKERSLLIMTTKYFLAILLLCDEDQRLRIRKK